MFTFLLSSVKLNTAGLNPKGKHFGAHLHLRCVGAVSKLFVMKSNQWVCITSKSIFIIKAPSFAEISSIFREKELFVIPNDCKICCLELVIHFTIRSPPGWMCVIAHPPINWFSTLVQICRFLPVLWGCSFFPLCMCLGRISTQQLPAAADRPPILWWAVPDWFWWFPKLPNSLRECKSWVSSSSGISFPLKKKPTLLVAIKHIA